MGVHIDLEIHYYLKCGKLSEVVLFVLSLYLDVPLQPLCLVLTSFLMKWQGNQIVVFYTISFHMSLINLTECQTISGSKTLVNPWLSR